MRRLILFSAIVALIVWRSRKLDEQDRAHGFGPYAAVRPVIDP